MIADIVQQIREALPEYEVRWGWRELNNDRMEPDLGEHIIVAPEGEELTQALRGSAGDKPLAQRKITLLAVLRARDANVLDAYTRAEGMARIFLDRTRGFLSASKPRLEWHDEGGEYHALVECVISGLEVTGQFTRPVVSVPVEPDTDCCDC